MTQTPSTAVQDYLKAIHRLGGTDRLVPPAELVSLLRVKASSVTGMLKRLSEAGFIIYESGAGAKLTESGLSEALRVIRRHRLLETFLTRVLGLDWSEVDIEAEALEHAISPRLEQAIASYLGEPLEDPHGHPIPTADGELQRRQLHRLSDYRQHQLAIIREVQDDKPERLRHWRKLGLVPGATVRILNFHELDDLFEVEVGDRVLQVGSEGLHGLWCETLADPANA